MVGDQELEMNILLSAVSATARKFKAFWMLIVTGRLPTAES
jgi:hypothetical protein